MLRRRKYVIAPSDAVSPLDSDEQDEVVANLAQQAKHQTALIKRGFFVGLAFFSLVTVFCLFQLLLAHDKLLPHRVPLDTVPDAWFFVTYVAQLLGLYFAHGITQGNRRLVFPGMVISSTNLVAWLAVFGFRGVTNPLLFWIPLNPAIAIGISFYLSTSERALGNELEELKRLQYDHKKL